MASRSHDHGATGRDLPLVAPLGTVELRAYGARRLACVDVRALSDAAVVAAVAGRGGSEVVSEEQQKKPRLSCESCGAHWGWGAPWCRSKECYAAALARWYQEQTSAVEP